MSPEDVFDTDELSRESPCTSLNGDRGSHGTKEPTCPKDSSPVQNQRATAGCDGVPWVQGNRWEHYLRRYSRYHKNHGRCLVGSRCYVFASYRGSFCRGPRDIPTMTVVLGLGCDNRSSRDNVGCFNDFTGLVGNDD